MCVLASAPVGLVADGQSTATSIPLGFSPPTLRSMQLLGSSSARGGGDFQLTGQGKGTVVFCVSLSGSIWIRAESVFGFFVLCFACAI